MRALSDAETVGLKDGGRSSSDPAAGHAHLCMQPSLR